jgi:cytochrome c oxidase cbb3-type subunit II
MIANVLSYILLLNGPRQKTEQRTGGGWLATWVLTAAGLGLAAGSGLHAEPRGEELYLQHCAVCHQPNGKGIPGFFPPLAGNEHVTTEDPVEVQEHLGRIIFGYHGGLIIDHQMYSGRMPPIGYQGRMNDSELLDLINYQRTAWGNDARPVTFSELAEARAAGRP